MCLNINGEPAPKRLSSLQGSISSMLAISSRDEPSRPVNGRRMKFLGGSLISRFMSMLLTVCLHWN